MQRDVKIGIAIGVLLIALIGIFWFTKGSNEPTLPPQPVTETLPELGAPIEPVAPVGGGELPAISSQPAGPEVSIPDPITQPVPPTAGPGMIQPIPSSPATLPVPTEHIAPPAPTQKTHVVASGDTLSSLSKKYYGDEKYWNRIFEANTSKLPNPNSLKVGMELVIPDAGGASTGSSATVSGERTHIVAAGDTLSAISKKYYNTEAKWRLIYNANTEKIPSADRLQVGTVLVIPPEE